jgi:hypothetical protein
VRPAQITIMAASPSRVRARHAPFARCTAPEPLSLWIEVQPRVSSRSRPVPCSAIRFQALLGSVGGRDLLGSRGIPAQQRAGPCRAPRSRAAASEVDTPPGPGAAPLWGFCGDLGLRGCVRHHGMPALPGIFAGKVGCSAFTEPVWPENDRPAEKRKVDSSILSLTTLLTSGNVPLVTIRMQIVKLLVSFISADGRQFRTSSQVTGLHAGAGTSDRALAPGRRGCRVQIRAPDEWPPTTVRRTASPRPVTQKNWILRKRRCADQRPLSRLTGVAGDRSKVVAWMPESCGCACGS